MFDFMENIFPVIVLFLLFRGILQTIFGKRRKKRQQELPTDYEQQEAENQAEPAQTSTRQQKPDLASEFERLLNKPKEKAQEKPSEKIDENPDVITDDEVKQRVHRDDGEYHEGKGRIHRWGEAYNHDKGKVFYDPRGDYSYNEEKQNAIAFSAAVRKDEDGLAQPKVSLRHKELVNGFIMSQVLDRPRGLKPYGDEEML